MLRTTFGRKRERKTVPLAPESHSQQTAKGEMQTLPKMANPHKGTGWSKTSDPWSHERCALWRSRGPDFEESFQEGVCGWAG